MNKKLYLLLPVALISTSLASCSNAEPKEKTFYDAIDQLKDGFKLKGVVHQTRTPLGLAPNGSMGPAGQPEEQGYNVEYTFENGEKVAIHKLTYALGELENLLFFCDDEGYAYEEQFTYKNEILKYYKLNNGEKIPFANSGFYNPFSIFNKEDFRYNEKYKRYDVNLDKTSIILNNLLYSVNSGFYGLPIRSSIKFSNEKLLKFDVTMDSRVSYEANNSNQITVYKYDNEVSFTFEDIGTAKVDRVVPFEDKKENEELKTALQSIGDNFTLLTETSKSLNGSTPKLKYRKFKFDGEQILVQKSTDTRTSFDTIDENEDFILKKIDETDLLFSHVLNKETNEWERKISKNFAYLYQNRFYYEDYLPVIKDISEDIFTYDQTTNEYVADEPYVVNALKSCFGVNKVPFNSTEIDNSYKISIRVTNDNKIDYVKFHFNYLEAESSQQSVSTGYVKLKYSDIGKTEVK